MKDNTLTIARLDREFTALIDMHHVYGAESIVNALVRATKGHPYLTKDDVFMLFYKAYQMEEVANDTE